MNPLNLIPSVIGTVGSFFEKRETRKTAKITINGKLKEAKINGNHEVVLNRQEWEAIGQLKQDKTWKDEYITVLITWPFIQMFLGGLEIAFTSAFCDQPTSIMFNGLSKSLGLLKELGVDLGYLMSAVVLAAIGIQVKRG